MSDALISIIRGSSPSSLENWPPSLPSINDSFKRLSAFDGPSEGDPPLLLNDDLRAEDLLIRFQSLVERIRNSIDDYSRFSENASALDVNIQRLKKQSEVLERDLDEVTAEESLRSDWTKTIGEQEKQVANAADKNKTNYLLDQNVCVSKYTTATARASFESVKGTPYYEDAVGGQRIFSERSFASMQVGNELRQNDYEIKRLDYFIQRKLSDVRYNILSLRRSKLQLQKAANQDDLKHLEYIKQSRYGASFGERLAGIAIDARHATRAMDRVGVQMVRAFRNIYGGLVEPQVLAFAESPGWTKDIDQGLVERCSCLEKYLSDLLYLVQARSSRAEMSGELTLTGKAKGIFEGSIRFTAEGITKLHKLPRLRGVAVYLDQSLVDQTSISLTIGPKGYRNFSGPYHGSQDVLQENAWPVLIGRPSLAGAPEPVTFHGIASLWNCSIFSDFKITAQAIGEAGEQPISIRLVLDYEYMN